MGARFPVIGLVMPVMVLDGYLYGLTIGDNGRQKLLESKLARVSAPDLLEPGACHT